MQLRLNRRMTRPVQTFGQRLRLARQKRNMTQPQLAAAAGLKQPNISKMERESTLATAGMARLANALGVSSRWLEIGDVPDPDWTEPQHLAEGAQLRGQVAHVLSHHKVSDRLPVITWEEAVKNQLPARFAVEMPDDSMAPWIRRGDLVRFASTHAASAGDVVLVADSAGGLYVRTYRQRRAGEWQAAPASEAYESLDSVRDALRLVGVFTGLDRP
jgi:transcriptional regulator with XRE-family HTH domain